MRALCTISIVAFLTTGCADISEKPSYLGAFLPDSGDEQTAPPPAREPPAAIRHVTSNRVLGAMAFEKVTRQKVDPTRLTEPAR